MAYAPVGCAFNMCSTDVTCNKYRPYVKYDTYYTYSTCIASMERLFLVYKDIINLDKIVEA